MVTDPESVTVAPDNERTSPSLLLTHGKGPTAPCSETHQGKRYVYDDICCLLKRVTKYIRPISFIYTDANAVGVIQFKLTMKTFIATLCTHS